MQTALFSGSTIHGVITFFNEFAETFFGFSEHEILGKNIIGYYYSLS